MQPFTVSVVVRGYELDTQGHLNQAIYLIDLKERTLVPDPRSQLRSLATTPDLLG